MRYTLNTNSCKYCYYRYSIDIEGFEDEASIGHTVNSELAITTCYLMGEDKRWHDNNHFQFYTKL